MVKKMVNKEESMKIVIHITKGKKKAEIPVKFDELTSLFDTGFMISPETIETMKLNKVNNYFWSLIKKVEKIMDYKYEGGCFQIVDGKMVKSKHKFYYSGKRMPKWKK